MINMTEKKERLKPISFYGHKVEDVIRAFMQADPKKVERRQKKKRSNIKRV